MDQYGEEAAVAPDLPSQREGRLDAQAHERQQFVLDGDRELEGVRLGSRTPPVGVAVGQV